jgi:hypothetical protein
MNFIKQKRSALISKMKRKKLKKYDNAGNPKRFVDSMTATI